ncbi:uncharacterized protein LOC143903416 isoform X1 [Temnothorax americanus]|uniref:uncharacterized protein LOC143903416 isoform X1 n=1 Tax=Temnothorax americanus TaxID=1964332 RepID=UPI004069509F
MVPSKPLMLCSAISDANMGTTTDAAPHAAPAINRAKKILSMEKLDCVTWMGKKMLVDGQVLASNFFRFQLVTKPDIKNFAGLRKNSLGITVSDGFRACTAARCTRGKKATPVLIQARDAHRASDIKYK